MQSNTTGFSMETFFDIMRTCCMAFLAYINFAIYVKVKKFIVSDEIVKNHQAEILESLSVELDEISLKTVKMSAQLNDVQDELHRSSLALRTTQEPTKPMKSNNWDSVRECFKGPARIEVNERN